jgi:hypothetical protein
MGHPPGDGQWGEIDLNSKKIAVEGRQDCDHSPIVLARAPHSPDRPDRGSKKGRFFSPPDAALLRDFFPYKRAAGSEGGFLRIFCGRFGTRTRRQWDRDLFVFLLRDQNGPSLRRNNYRRTKKA